MHVACFNSECCVYSFYSNDVIFLLESDVADFDGRSSLLYRFNQKSMSTVKDVISLRFKSRQAEGVLLHGEGQRGDYITLELHRGKLALYLNLGESQLFYKLTLQIHVFNMMLKTVCFNDYCISLLT